MSICRQCGKPKQTKGSASLTQWFLLCSCEFQAPESADDTKLCSTCGKRIYAGREGSFTQWIFRYDICSCRHPQLDSAAFPGVGTLRDGANSADAPATEFAEDTGFEQEGSGEDIHVSEKSFPVERYKPLKLLGSGVSGAVYLCRDTLLQKKVAIKTSHQLTERELIWFQREAKSLCKLNHKGIVSVLDFGATASGAPFLVMEYFQGTDLDTLRRSTGGLDWKETGRIMLGLCDALSYAHDNGVLHHDLKPSNILVRDYKSDAPAICLIDFGMAMLKGASGAQNGLTPQAEQNQTMIGTPAYASPDQISGAEYTIRSEIYSLGCIMFECIAGRPPFIGNTALDTLRLHATAAPPMMASINPSAEIPDSIQSIVSTCLSKDPLGRYHSVRGLKAAIKEVLEGEPLMRFTPQINAIPDRGKHKSKVSTVAIFTAGCALILACITLQFTGSRRSENPSSHAQERRSQPPTPIEKSTSSKPERLSLDDKDPEPAVLPVSLKPLNSIFIYDRKAMTVQAKAQLSDADLTHFIDKPVASLDLNVQPELTDECCRYIAKIPELRLVFIKGSKITDLGLKRLCRSKTLNQLILGGCGVTDEGLKYLPNDMYTIGLADDRISDEGAKVLLRCTHLHVLDLSSTFITDETLSYISKLAELQHVALLGCPDVSARGIGLLSNNRAITSLHLTDTGVTDDCIIQLQGLNLQQLDVSKCRGFTNRGLEFVSKRWPNLTYLGINRTSVNREGLVYLNRFKILNTLLIGGPDITDKEMELVYPMQHLEYLDLSYTNVTDKTLDNLAKMTTLTSLKLDYCEKLSMSKIEAAQKRFKILSAKRKSALPEIYKELLDTSPKQ